MLKILLERFRQGHRTAAYPVVPPTFSARFRGRPQLEPANCAEGCQACAEACPTGAISHRDGSLQVDLGRCLFCVECTRTCPSGALSFTRDHRLAGRRREHLWARSGEAATEVEPLEPERLRLFRRSLKLRQVSAGGCNACEADVNVLGTVVFDLGRFGIQMVASPRHADGLLITGPVTENMRLALKKTYDAIPPPKLVIAVGACAISGGAYAGQFETRGGAEHDVPVDLFIPGCPPHPYTILDGLLSLLGRLSEERAQALTEAGLLAENAHWAKERAEHELKAVGADLGVK